GIICFNTVICAGGVNSERELNIAGPAFREVKGIIAYVDTDYIFQIYSTAEHFKAVILSGVGLNILNCCTRAYSIQCKTIQLTAIHNVITRMFDNYITQGAGILRIIVTTIGGRTTFGSDVAVVRIVAGRQTLCIAALVG